VDAEDVLTPEEEAIVRQGERQLRQGKSKPWSQTKDLDHKGRRELKKRLQEGAIRRATRDLDLTEEGLPP
jgi:hypothetical protein